MVSHVIDKEMGFEAQDFAHRLLQVLGPDAVSHEAPGETVIRHPSGGKMMVAYRQAAPRCIASLTLPVLRVRLSFDGFPNNDTEAALLERFNHTFQRGGG